jgi:hypothetical protein
MRQRMLIFLRHDFVPLSDDFQEPDLNFALCGLCRLPLIRACSELIGVTGSERNNL